MSEISQKWGNAVTRESTYSPETIANICDEIERQWEYHLVSRAAFPVNVVDSPSQYSSPPFYRSALMGRRSLREEPIRTHRSGMWASGNQKADGEHFRVPERFLSCRSDESFEETIRLGDQSLGRASWLQRWATSHSCLPMM